MGNVMHRFFAMSPQTSKSHQFLETARGYNSLRLLILMRAVKPSIKFPPETYRVANIIIPLKC